MALDRDLIYSWNRAEGPEFEIQTPPRLNDETLRDWLQSPSVLDPPIEKKIRLLHLMDELGIDQVDLGLPGAGPRAREDVLRLAREIVASKLCLRADCAARTVESDIRPIADIVQATGLEIEAATLSGLQPDSPVGGGLESRLPLACHGKGGEIRHCPGRACHVRYGRYHAGAP
jgi:2-isopropylmalate synthase